MECRIPAAFRERLDSGGDDVPHPLLVAVDRRRDASTAIAVARVAARHPLLCVERLRPVAPALKAPLDADGPLPVPVPERSVVGRRIVEPAAKRFRPCGSRPGVSRCGLLRCGRRPGVSRCGLLRCGRQPGVSRCERRAGASCRGRRSRARCCGGPRARRCRCGPAPHSRQEGQRGARQHCLRTHAGLPSDAARRGNRRHGQYRRLGAGVEANPRPHCSCTCLRSPLRPPTRHTPVRDRSRSRMFLRSQ